MLVLSIPLSILLLTVLSVVLPILVRLLLLPPPCSLGLLGWGSNGATVALLFVKKTGMFF